MTPEGTQNDLLLRIRYDFESSEVPQPGNFAVGNLSSASLFGTALFGTGIFGATTLPSKSILVTGSGFSNKLKEDFYTELAVHPRTNYVLLNSQGATGLYQNIFRLSNNDLRELGGSSSRPDSLSHEHEGSYLHHQRVLFLI